MSHDIVSPNGVTVVGQIPPSHSCAVLANGRFMLGLFGNRLTAIFDPRFGYINQPPMISQTGGDNLTKCVASKDNFLVSEGSFPTTLYWKLVDEDGTLLRSRTVTASSASVLMALSIDNQIGYYANPAGAIIGVTLSSGATTTLTVRSGHTATSGICLPNGNVIICWDDQILMYSSGGSVMRGFALPPPTARATIAVHPDYRSFWVLTDIVFGPVELRQYDIASGGIVKQIRPPATADTSFCVFPQGIVPSTVPSLPVPPPYPNPNPSPPPPYIVDHRDIVDQVYADDAVPDGLDPACAAFTLTCRIASQLALQGEQAGVLLWDDSNPFNPPPLLKPLYSCVAWGPGGGNGFTYWADIVCYLPSGTAYYTRRFAPGPGSPLGTPCWAFAGMVGTQFWFPPLPL